MNPLDKFFQASPSFGFLRKTKKSTMASKDGDTPDPEEEAKEETIAGMLSEEYLAKIGMTREEMLERLNEAITGGEVPKDPKDTFQHRCRSLGHLKVKMARAIGAAKEWLNPDQYASQTVELVSMRHADQLLKDCEESFAALLAKREWAEELLEEDDLMTREDYMSGPYQHLQEVRRLYGLRADFNDAKKLRQKDETAKLDADALKTTIEGAVAGAVAVAESNAEKFASNINVVMGLNYVMSKNLKKFGGSLTEYPGFRDKLDKAIERMREMRKSDAEILDELQLCLEGPALKQIKSLPSRNENLQIALDTLDVLFGDRYMYLTHVIGNLFQLPKMSDNVVSLMNGYGDLNNFWEQLQSVDMTSEDFGLHLFLAIVNKKLSPETLKKFNRLLNKQSDKDSSTGVSGLTYKGFKECLEEAIRDAQRMNKQDDDQKNRQKQDHQGNLPRSFAGANDSEGCLFCGQSHKSLFCHTMKKMKATDVFKIVMDKKACVKCFSTGHSKAKYCKEAKNCEKLLPGGEEKCNKNHASKLHSVFQEMNPKTGQKFLQTRTSGGRKEEKENKNDGTATGSGSNVGGGQQQFSTPPPPYGTSDGTSRLPNWASQTGSGAAGSSIANIHEKPPPSTRPKTK